MRVSWESSSQRRHREDDIVLGEEELAGARQRRVQALHEPAGAPFGLGLDAVVLDEVATECNQVGPGPAEWPRHRE
jgi:hypothetical protein